MTRTPGPPGSAGVRFLISAAAVAVTLVAWVSLAQVAHVDVSDAESTTVTPVMSAEPVDVPDVVDVTASAFRTCARSPMTAQATRFATGAAVLVGAVVGFAVIPVWSSVIADALGGPQPQGWWLLSRASGFVAYGALCLSMWMGLTITNRWARVWPGGPTAIDLHRHASLLALAFVLVHALVLLGDRYVDFTLAAILLPFSAPTEKWLAIAAGQVALYTLALIVGSFYVRRAIGTRLWRAIHFATFALFALATVHGIVSGTDSASAIYWTGASTVLFLTVHRMIRVLWPKPKPI